jgi:hypothetical protein
MAQAVSRRPPTAEARVRSRFSPCGICVGQSGTGTGFSLSPSVFRCQFQFHSTGAPLLGKGQKIIIFIFITGLQNMPQGCVRSVLCGAFHHLTVFMNTLWTGRSVVSCTLWQILTLGKQVVLFAAYMTCMAPRASLKCWSKETCNMAAECTSAVLNGTQLKNGGDHTTFWRWLTSCR